MKSSSGAHYLALDHIRALAALLVVVWHFTHWTSGYPVPFQGAPLLPLAIFDEGHTGVALFMALSGYLFAKLIGERRINYAAFLWNRALRLLPLLMLVILLVGLQKLAAGEDLHAYALSIARGLVWPTLPNSGWSITAEAHFYLILPLLLWATRKSRVLLVCMVLAAIVLRALIMHRTGSAQFFAYQTIVGRFDQFALGVLFFNLSHRISGRHALAASVAAAFLAFYWWFDRAGGYYALGGHPSTSALWVVMPTIEGAAYGLLIAWYDRSFTQHASRASLVVARFGELSYSIYLLHPFFVAGAADFVHRHVMDISSFYTASLWAVVFFALMYVPAALSYRLIESPALRLRKRYVRSELAVPVAPPLIRGAGAQPEKRSHPAR